ncbi:tryptophan halogenase family protein [Coralloluteibacterium stylophorae]|uniref:Tryptophan 7-halogenase n=1 Tax=Coralloluteibacterium stylophorae TaxID=1776034 RepID=A0A8J7VTM6_9GAMM|nr:tryptophan halogenase family protein [Coralloluteibacterium stylophorae]MBS7458668.1 tryptophan 7-halogenase [Coralloluteibacterium stylophorae]
MASEAGKIRKVVIAGGGTAGWLAACALTHQFRDLLDIVLVESEQIGTVGVGESTVPTIRTFHRLLGIDEREFMSAVAGSFKLSISFENWTRPGERYFHPFGYTGAGTWSCEFHHFWLDSLRRGMPSAFGDFCLESVASRAGRFALSDREERGAPQWSLRWARNPNAPARPEPNYAYHFDAALYADFLRRKSEGRGLTRIEGRILEVRRDPGSGNVDALVLEDGQVVEGDLFIDCSGFRGLLIEQAMRTGYEDWNQWLPCDRAVALQTAAVEPAVPYTRAIAHEAGWRWHIALQHRVGCGWVFSSAHMSDDEAAARLVAATGAPLVREPWIVSFRTGRRRRAWNGNVVALGLASGFIEPLESTSIHLTLSAIARLIHLFPADGIEESLVERYNEVSRREMEQVRDFIVMHYHLNQRDEPLWRECRDMRLPEALAERIRLFRDRAHAWQGEDELFRLDSWTHVMLGQGVVPRTHHPLGAALGDADLRRLFDAIRRPIDQAVQAMPEHQAFLERYCPADPAVWAQRKRQPSPA